VQRRHDPLPEHALALYGTVCYHIRMRKTLILTAGLSVAGTSTVAERLSAASALPVVSVDPLEAAMWGAGIPQEMTGVAADGVARAVAREQRRLGLSVIVDAVHPVEAARAIWRTLASEQLARLLVIECVCSDTRLHRARVRARRRDIPGMPEVTWEQVEERRREYEPRADDRLVLDTAQSLDDVTAVAVGYVRNG
jgi:predicted kinase